MRCSQQREVGFFQPSPAALVDATRLVLAEVPQRATPRLHRACACLAAASQRPRSGLAGNAVAARGAALGDLALPSACAAVSGKKGASVRIVFLVTLQGSGSDCAVQPWSEASFEGGGGRGAGGLKGVASAPLQLHAVLLCQELRKGRRHGELPGTGHDRIHVSVVLL